MWAGEEKPSGRGRQRNIPPSAPSLFLRAAEQRARPSLSSSSSSSQIKSFFSRRFASSQRAQGPAELREADAASLELGYHQEHQRALTVPCEIVCFELSLRPCDMFCADGAPAVAKGGHGAPADSACQCTAVTDYCRIAPLGAHGARAQPVFIDFGCFALL